MGYRRRIKKSSGLKAWATVGPTSAALRSFWLKT